MRNSLTQFKNKAKNYFVVHDLEFIAAGGSALALTIAYFFGKAHGTTTQNIFVATLNDDENSKPVVTLTEL